jgi:hypothetical protein
MPVRPAFALSREEAGTTDEDGNRPAKLFCLFELSCRDDVFLTV